MKQKGFTLIELIIVIVLLGILAATALPRFVNLNDDAYIASVQGVGGALGAGVQIAHARWLADSNTGADDIILQGLSIGMNADGYPVGGSGVTEIGGDSDCVSIWNNLIQNPPLVDTTDVLNDAAKYTASGDNTTQECRYTLKDGNTPRFIDYRAQTGTVDITAP